MSLTREKHEGLNQLISNGLINYWTFEREEYKRIIRLLHGPNRRRITFGKLEARGLPVFAEYPFLSSDILQHEEKIEVPFKSDRGLKSRVKFYTDQSYSYLKQMRPDLKSDTVNLKEEILSTIDGMVKFTDRNKRELLFGCLDWSLGSLKNYHAKKMYAIGKNPLVVENISKSRGGMLQNLTIMQKEAATLQFYVDIITQILFSKRYNKEFNLSNATKAIRNKRVNEKKVGRKPHALAQKKSVQSIIEDCANNTNFIHKNGRHEGKYNWTKIASITMRKHGWDDSDIDLKTLKRKAKEIILES